MRHGPISTRTAVVWLAAAICSASSLGAQQSAVHVLLRNGTVYCDVPMPRVEGSDLRLEVAADGTTVLVPRDSVRSAWSRSRPSADARLRSLRRGAIVGLVVPIAVAAFSPARGGAFGDPNASPRPFYFLIAIGAAPFTAAIGAFFGLVGHQLSNPPASRDVALVPLGPEDDEADASRVIARTCR